MSSQANVFPFLSEDALQAAEAVPGRPVYMTLGLQIEQLLAGIDLARLDPAGIRSTTTLAVMALVTVFQYVEDLPDRRAAKATHTRLDWKYALHLARTYPGLEYRLLCRFRRPLLQDPDARQVFQQIIDRLAETDLLRCSGGRRIEADEVLTVVCGLSRLEQLIEAMRMVLEAVAAFEPEWLRTVARPHWYERYGALSAERPLPRAYQEQVALVQAFGVDARYLLEVIHAAANERLTALPEVQELQQLWLERFVQPDDQLSWSMPACAFCFLH